MSDDVKDAVAVITVIILAVFALIATVFVFAMQKERENDEYCRTIPMERMDKERCGIDE